VAFAAWLLTNWALSSAFTEKFSGQALQAAFAFTVAMIVATIASQKAWLWPTIRLRWSDEGTEVRGEQLVFSVVEPQTDYIVWDLAVTRNQASWLGRRLLARQSKPCGGRLELVLSDPDVLSLSIEAPDSPKFYALEDRWVLCIDDLRRSGVIANVALGASLKHNLRPATITVDCELHSDSSAGGGKRIRRILLTSAVKELVVKKAAS
jgi:hypothetical protein